jgi:WD40 repeat protein
MATASNDKKMKIFNTEDLTELPITFNDTEDFTLVIQFSPDGQLIVTGAYNGEKNLVSRPTHVDFLVNDICSILTRNMDQNEWNTYVGKDIVYEKTCPDKTYNIKMDAIK